MLTLISFFWTIFWSLSCYPLLMSIVLWPLKHPLEILNWQIFYFGWWHTVYHILAGVEPLQWNLKPDIIFEKFLMSCEHALNSSTFVMRVIDTFLLFLCTVLHIAVRLSESLYSVEGIGENGMLIDVLNWLSRLTASVTCFPSSCNAGTCQAISHGYAISRKGIQQKSGFNFFWPFILYRYRHFPWVAA